LRQALFQPPDGHGEATAATTNKQQAAVTTCPPSS
jgi:hypothetical protein